MDKQEFINKIAGYVKQYAPAYGIKVYSPIIAQAILESAYGTSELAINAHNYFGLKYRAGRCKTCSGIYTKVGSEQYEDGSYVSSSMQWCKFNSMVDGVVGYFDFINISTYKNLKGVTNPRVYLENIKADGYATSLNYVTNLMAVIDNWNLTKYDPPIQNTSKTELYRVRKSWEDSSSQLGAFANLQNAINLANKNIGYIVYDKSGNAVYSGVTSYTVKVKTPPILIYKDADINSAVVGSISNIGVYTIVAESTNNSIKWGKLKSGIGWIMLDKVLIYNSTLLR